MNSSGFAIGIYHYSPFFGAAKLVFSGWRREGPPPGIARAGFRGFGSLFPFRGGGLQEAEGLDLLIAGFEAFLFVRVEGDPAREIALGPRGAEGFAFWAVVEFVAVRGAFALREGSSFVFAAVARRLARSSAVGS
jgi:hypothetical protein